MTDPWAMDAGPGPMCNSSARPNAEFQWHWLDGARAGGLPYVTICTKEEIAPGVEITARYDISSHRVAVEESDIESESGSESEGLCECGD